MIAGAGALVVGLVTNELKKKRERVEELDYEEIYDFDEEEEETYNEEEE